MSRNYTEAKAAWLALEEFAAMKPADDKACRSCGRGATGPLCVTCENHRRDLYKRFAGRQTSHRPGRKFSAQREEWTPYKESEDRRG